MRITSLRSLLDRQLITDKQFAVLESIYEKRIFSLYYELRAMLSVGVLLFSTGAGILVYLNIETIGHQAILLLLTVLMGWCFWYSNNVRLPYSSHKVASPSLSYDYIIFLGCLLFTTIVSYLQFQYEVFGDRWEFSALLPALVFFPLAYYFDHRGVLSLAITGLASWLGLTVSPVKFLNQGIYSEYGLIMSGLGLGTILVLSGAVLDRREIKRHFTFTYYHFGAHLLFLSCLAGLILQHAEWVYFPLLSVLVTVGIWYAKREQSFLMLLLAIGYGYVGLTYMVSKLDPSIGMWYWYLIVTGGAFIFVIFQYKKFFRR